MSYSGRCACGTVTYICGDDPEFSYHCYCKHCQRAGGAGHASLFMLTKKTFELVGELSSYERISDKGNTVARHFCSNCGSQVLLRSTGYPDKVFVHAGTLDDASTFKPMRHLWLSEAQPWDSIDTELHEYVAP